MIPAVLICGDLSAKRPGEATRKQPLPAERQRLGAVYRALRNAYEAACIKIENAAAAMEREAQEIEASHAVDKGAAPTLARVEEAPEGAKRRTQ